MNNEQEIIKEKDGLIAYLKKELLITRIMFMVMSGVYILAIIWKK